jgi:DNA mismatch repair protein MutS2
MNLSNPLVNASISSPLADTHAQGPGLENDLALEWTPFLRHAADHASSLPAREQVLSWQDSSVWAASVSSAQLRQEQTEECLALLPKTDLWSALDQRADPTPSLERLSRGAILEVSEWHLIRRWLKAQEAFRLMSLNESESQLPQVRALIASLPNVQMPLTRLERLLTPEGELSETASTKLQVLASELRSLKREISSRLDSLSRDYLQKGLLQGEYTDIRDGRYVLPVKISSQSEVPGLIYESSVSRQTVFIEPREVTEINNRLSQKQNEWYQEVHRILTELSHDCAPQARTWQASVELLVHWDAVHARAAIALRYQGLKLECGSDALDLTATAHPLLWWSLPEERIQRNSLRLEPHQRALLITGPNTGGKTVLLKTLGMAAIFSRTGFFFPTDRPGKVPFFERLFTDLGDTQSIESHLSSFSGHLVQFQRILKESNPRSLVLLDELNSATDPEEGAALSRALLETLLERGSWIVTTTHDPVLKSLGRQDARILTAAMAFDESSRLPTYRLELGVPGRSRALETAERLGIPSEVIAKARGFLSTQHREWESWVKELETQVAQARLAAEQAEELRLRNERRHDELQARIQELESELKQRARQRVRQLLENAQQEIREKLDEIQKAPNRKIIEAARHDLVRDAEAISERVDASLDRELEAAGISREARKERPKPLSSHEHSLEVGARVRIAKWKSQGTILEIRPDGMVRVAMGNLQMTLKDSEIELIPGSASAPRAAKLTWNTESTPGLGSTLDLRGLRLDEALSQVEKYLSQVYSSQQFAQVHLVHGLGTGALREGIRKLLRRLPFVIDFRDGGAGAGGTGATTVDLRY